MKKRILPLALALLLFSSCWGGRGEKAPEPERAPEAYGAVEYALPGDIRFIEYVDVREARIYAVAASPAGNDRYEQQIISMEPDGGGLEVIAGQPEGESFYGLALGPGGQVWTVLARGPDPDMDTCRLARLDSGGGVVESIPLDFIVSRGDFTVVDGLAIDGAGNFYVSAMEVVYVAGPDGELLFSLDREFAGGGVAVIPDGPAYTVTGDGKLTALDISGGGVGRKLQAISPAAVCSARGELYYSGGDGLYRIDPESGDGVQIISWQDYGVENIFRFLALPDGRFFGVAQDRQSVQTMFVFTPGGESRRLEIEQAAGDGEKTVLTLGTVGRTYDLEELVGEFNRRSEDYRVEIVDYWTSEDPEDYAGGRQQLMTELIAGQVPDMLFLDVMNIPVSAYVGLGLFEDLYPYIDSDPTLSREDFFPNILAAAEVDGALYHTVSSFDLKTVLGRADRLGEGAGWTWDELDAVAAEYPGMEPITSSYSREFFLTDFVDSNYEYFIDWAAGTCRFTDGTFARLLEYCATLEEAWPESSRSALLQGGALSLYTTVYNFFYSVDVFEQLFGAEVVFKGFPTAEGAPAHSVGIEGRLALSAVSEHKEAAWSFMRMTMAHYSEYDREYRFYVGWGELSSRRDVMEETAEHAMEPKTYIDADGNEVETFSMRREYDDGTVIETAYATRAQVDQLMELILSVDRAQTVDLAVGEIVREEALAYFHGDKTADQVAEIVQNRVQTYIHEQR